MKNQLTPDSWADLYADTFLTIAKFKINNGIDAEDIVQDTFLSAFKARASFRGDSSEKTWLLSILNNKIIDYYKNKRQNTPIDVINDVEIDFNYFDSDGHWKKEVAPKKWDMDASTDVLMSELKSIINLCFNKLPSKLKSIATLKFEDEKDTDFICQSIDITPSNFWTSLHRSRLLLRECIEQNYFFKID